MADQSDQELSDIYAAIVASLLHGLLRFYEAEAASARLMSALLAHYSERSNGNPSETNSETLYHLAKIPLSSYDSLAYITDVSHLVYATTLLDTFLTDTLLFLFLRFPESIGANQQISLKRLLASSSLSDALVEAANRRAKEVSFLSFSARLEFFRATYNLKIELDQKTSDALDHFPSVRNAIVHDQGIVELSLGPKGQIVSRQKACVRHPTAIKRTDAQAAAGAYATVCKGLSRAVFVQVLKVPDHKMLRVIDETRAL